MQQAVAPTHSSSARVCGVARLSIDSRAISSVIIHIPLLQDFEDHSGRETRPHQHPHHARGLFFVRRLLHTLSLKMPPRQLFLVHFLIRGIERLRDHFGVHALFASGPAARAACQAVVLLTQLRVAPRRSCIIQIAMRLQPRDHARRFSPRPVRPLCTLSHQPFQLGNGPHAPPQSGLRHSHRERAHRAARVSS